MARITLYRTECDLTVHGSIGSKKKLLSGLASGIECTAHLSTTERPVGKKSAIFPCERNALSDTLVDDVIAHFGKSIDIRLTATVVAAFDGLIEKTVDRVIVILVVLGGIDTTLCGNGMCTAWRVAYTEYLNIITKLTKCSSCRCTSKPGSDDNDFEFPLVAGIDKPSGILEINFSAIL